MKTKNTCFLTAFNQKVLLGIKKLFEDVHLDAKRSLNFNCLTMKFHNCHHANLQLTIKDRVETYFTMLSYSMKIEFTRLLN